MEQLWHKEEILILYFTLNYFLQYFYIFISVCFWRTKYDTNSSKTVLKWNTFTSKNHLQTLFRYLETSLHLCNHQITYKVHTVHGEAMKRYHSTRRKNQSVFQCHGFSLEHSVYYLTTHTLVHCNGYKNFRISRKAKHCLIQNVFEYKILIVVARSQLNVLKYDTFVLVQFLVETVFTLGSVYLLWWWVCPP